MTYHVPAELHDLVQRHMAAGNYLSEAELLLTALRSVEEESADWTAVEESLNTLDRGAQGVSLEEAFDLIRHRHNIPADA